MILESPLSLLKSSFTTLQALSVTFTRRLDGPCYSLYLHSPHPPLTEKGYTCYLLLASLFPALISPLRLNPIPSHHASLNCEHGTNEKAAFFFFSPVF